MRETPQVLMAEPGSGTRAKGGGVSGRSSLGKKNHRFTVKFRLRDKLKVGPRN